MSKVNIAVFMDSRSLTNWNISLHLRWQYEDAVTVSSFNHSGDRLSSLNQRGLDMRWCVFLWDILGFNLGKVFMVLRLFYKAESVPQVTWLKKNCWTVINNDSGWKWGERSWSILRYALRILIGQTLRNTKWNYSQGIWIQVCIQTVHFTSNYQRA